MFVREDDEWLADMEEELTGKTRERLIVGLHAALD